jgi:hypothetical protein
MLATKTTETTKEKKRMMVRAKDALKSDCRPKRGKKHPHKKEMEIVIFLNKHTKNEMGALGCPILLFTNKDNYS